MNLIPTAISRKVASQVLLGRKNSPTILFGVGVVSMLGSTVMACRATLKLDDVLSEIEANKAKASLAKEMVESGEAGEDVTYSDSEYKQDSYIILVKGAVRVVKLYAPAVILGGVGVVCLTKSHQILKERNLALTAAYVAVDTAFARYRERVVDRYGEDVDRELRYEYEEVDVIDEETGKVTSQVVVASGEHGMYARWFDSDNANWQPVPYDDNNWLFLRTQQNWANDLLRARGHMFLNEVYGMLGLPHTTAGSVVGWVYDRDNQVGDNFIDFGCFNNDGASASQFMNGREGAILLDFNVDGSIWQLIDELAEKKR